MELTQSASITFKVSTASEKTVVLVSSKEKVHCHICTPCQFFHLFPSSQIYPSLY